MESKQMKLLDFLGADQVIFTVPVFQRVYSWTENQCCDLWEDIALAAQSGKPHFSGVLLYNDQGQDGEGRCIRNIIDGQQRLTTLNLTLIALSETLKETDSEQARALAGSYLLNDGPTPRLRLTGLDDETLAALVCGDPLPEEPAERILQNLELFRGKMAQPGFDGASFLSGLAQLEVIALAMANAEGPQFVFESLNAKGVRLALADLVRNLVIASEREDQERLFDLYWEPFEELAAALPARYDSSLILSAWLASLNPDRHLQSRNEAFDVFKECLIQRYNGSIEGLLAELLEYSRIFADNDVMRLAATDEAERWLAGKPKDSISELKMFGD